MFRHKLIVSGISLMLGAPLSVLAADNAEILQIRDEIKAMKQSYEARIEALEQRLQRAETGVSKAETRAAQAEPAVAPATARQCFQSGYFADSVRHLYQPVTRPGGLPHYRLHAWRRD